ncbi:MAG: hypothetical protein Q3M24_08350 [Candidatus Electrothrix aestuarii]|uniref:Lipoprotein n=1 Tax=Candidatus Electrothrix aestuarii TaxID=3062594 RepID=A0AAU8LZR6_9BACT|nr:hypothetical protein [Candidatus Electrothrix aestuarii]
MKNCLSISKVLLFSLITITLFLSGCISSILPGSAMQGAGVGDMLPAVGGFADDIQDVIVPVEMEWDREKSMAIKTESFHGGIWHYTGFVETASLKDYMIRAMEDTNWKLVGEAASGDIMLAFVKPHKTCMMTIAEHDFRKTGLTLYVTIDKTAAIGLNPFGEPIPTK